MPNTETLARLEISKEFPMANPNLKTTYCGIEMRNPLMAGSSALTGNLPGIKKLAEAGVGGVVLKSLFEEQLQAELGMSGDYEHPEGYDFLAGQAMALAPTDYLKLIAGARKETSVAVWASLNCLEGVRWQEYAREIENAGAHGLELNIAPLSLKITDRPGAAEDKVLDVVRKVRKVTKLPLSVKLGSQYAALPWLLDQLKGEGVQGAVLFNRFYKTDMDTEHLSLKTGSKTSVPSDFLDSLRWTAILSPQKTLDICATQGIQSSADLIKALLAGAQAVQVTSLFFLKGQAAAAGLITDLAAWMEKKGFSNLGDFRGALARKNDQGTAFERIQYVKALVGVE